VDLEFASLHGQAGIQKMNISLLLGRESGNGNRCSFHHELGVGVVPVDNGTGILSMKSFEQQRLGIAVMFEIAMKIEMIPGQVSKDAHLVGDSVDAIHRQGMRGNLHDHELLALRYHLM